MSHLAERNWLTVQLRAKQACTVDTAAGNQHFFDTDMLQSASRQTPRLTCTHHQHSLVTQVPGFTLNKVQPDR